jgi:glutamate dehydrogenase/leucine dehydrogenase
MSEMESLLKRFEEKEPEVVFEWSDSETEAKGWVVINSLRNGAAGGGTRMRKGLDKKEVESLAKTMEIKFTISGPQIGGAKSGIDFDPFDPRKHGVLERWYKAVFPLLKNYYGTGGDLNVDEIMEVIPITEALGLWHPQEGVVQGHFNPREPEKIKLIGQLRQGVSKVIEDPEYSPNISKGYTVADMITGYGVAVSIKQFYDLWEDGVEGKTAIIQGFGNVGGSCAFFLAKMGVRIKGIVDRTGGLIDENGMGYEDIKKLFLEKRENALHQEELIPFDMVNESIWDSGAEIFIPAAGSRLLSLEQIDRLIANGLECISCGANVPFLDEEIFLGPTGKFADQSISLIPDFIANCGMARVFAYLMDSEAEITDHAIFDDVSKTVCRALKKVYDEQKNPVEIASKAFEISLRELL